MWLAHQVASNDLRVSYLGTVRGGQHGWNLVAAMVLSLARRGELEYTSSSTHTHQHSRASFLNFSPFRSNLRAPGTVPCGPCYPRQSPIRITSRDGAASPAERGITHVWWHMRRAFLRRARPFGGKGSGGDVGGWFRGSGRHACDRFGGFSDLVARRNEVRNRGSN